MHKHEEILSGIDGAIDRARDTESLLLAVREMYLEQAHKVAALEVHIAVLENRLERVRKAIDIELASQDKSWVANQIRAVLDD